MENATPMFRQYLDIKKQYPGTILFFRLGDFYEMFNEDAVVGSRELEITLTARQKDSPNPIPMCGVPHHAAANYIARLVKKGYRVAICEQAEEAGKGVKLVKREVVRVITPGTAIDDQLLEPRESVYLAAVSGSDEVFAAAFLELSSGQFSVTQHSGADAWDKICEQISGRDPRELIFPQRLEKAVRSVFGATATHSLFDSDEQRQTSGSITLTQVEDDGTDHNGNIEVLCQQFGVRSLTAYGLEDRQEAIAAAAMCVRYARSTNKHGAAHISSIDYFEPAEYMVLDGVTIRNLEIVESRGELAKRTLFDVIDATVTGMGSRMLKRWLLMPSLKRSEIQTRLSAVEEFADAMLRDKVRFLLKDISDLERLIGKLNLGNATARDLLALARSLRRSPEINQTLADANSLLIQVLSENIFELPEIVDLISNGIDGDAPINLSDGGVIKTGFNAELDELRDISNNAKQIIAAFEESERERTGINTLKVRFNNVFGYYIEVSKAQASNVPDDYERRQTLANAERYTTSQLKEWESKVLGAEERILKLEVEIFNSVRAAVRDETRRLQLTARALATLDALAALSETAARRNYVRPLLHDGDEIEIKGGRHSIVEAFSRESFIPNDVLMNNSTDRLLIITGANMGGKSTILRQIALIQILAQIGSFVPASSARLPIVDRVWTRVGASDDLASGRSTFMVEMTETASILRNATSRSLILLDEIGRGTSTFDGLSIAWAVAEYLHDSPEHSAKTLFATHYHEITELAETLPGAKNYQITATEKDGEIVFFHKMLPGRASKSYGIAVGRLAGLPLSVVERAKAVLEKLEEYELAVFADERPSGIAKAAGGRAAAQTSLFAVANESVIDELRSANVDELSPGDAKDMLKAIASRII